MRFYFMLGLVLVTSVCGITAECGVNKSVNTSAANFYAFCETSLVQKREVRRLRTYCGTNSHNSLVQKREVRRLRTYCGTNSHNRRAEDQPEVSFFQNNFFNSGYSRPNSFRLPRRGSGSSISLKYVGITRSFATRSLGIPNLLKCISKAQPEPERSRSLVIRKHSSEAGAMLMKTESAGAGATSFLQELRSPGLSCEILELFFRIKPTK